MKLVALLTVFFSATVIAKPLFEIDWQDENFKQCVLKIAGEKGWSDTEEVTDIKCHSKKIKRAEDLQHFNSLQYLSLFNNQIKGADVSHLADLTSLNLAKNQLTQITFGQHPYLEKLYLFRNQLKSLEMRGLSRLKEVRLMQNRLEQLDITPLKFLETAHIFDNQLEDLQITGLSKLEFLDVRQNPMPDELYDFYDQQEGIVISHDGNADDWK